MKDSQKVPSCEASASVNRKSNRTKASLWICSWLSKQVNHLLKDASLSAHGLIPKPMKPEYGPKQCSMHWKSKLRRRGRVFQYSHPAFRPVKTRCLTALSINDAVLPRRNRLSPPVTRRKNKTPTGNERKLLHHHPLMNQYHAKSQNKSRSKSPRSQRKK